VNRMKVTFETRRENFPPNVEDLVIQQIVLFFAQSNDPPIEIKGVNLLFTSDGAGSPVGGAATTVNGVISTRATNGSTWIPMVGRAPAGTWELALPYDPSNLNDPATALIRDLFLGGPDNKGTIEDILLVITYSGETPAWPM